MLSGQRTPGGIFGKMFRISGGKTLPRQSVQRKERKHMNKKYVCKICGWVYDPAEHDNVAFEDLPSDWTCPVCGVGKADFEPAS